KFLSGKTIYLTNYAQTDDNKTLATLVPIDVGIILNITPKIDNLGQIDSKIDTEVSQAANIKENQVPVITKSQVTTDVTIKDGQTILLSGLVRKRNTKAVGRVPILADIPLFGELFKSRSTT